MSKQEVLEITQDVLNYVASMITKKNKDNISEDNIKISREDEKYLLSMQESTQKGDFLQVFNSILEKKVTLLIKEITNEEIEGLFYLLIAFLQKLSDYKSTDISKCYNKIIQIMFDNILDKTMIRLRIVSLLFNKVKQNDEIKWDTLIKMIQYASKTNQMDVVNSSMENMNRFFESNSLSTKMIQKIYLTMIHVLEKDETDTSKKLYLNYLDKYLSLPQDKENKENKDNMNEIAVQALKAFIQNPIDSFLLNIDFLSYNIMNEIKNKDTNKILYELANILSTKSLTDYSIFIKANPNIFKKYVLLIYSLGFSEKACQMNMRLLCLTNFELNKDITYNDVMKILELDNEDQVETYIMNGISKGVIEGKINQNNKIIMITRKLLRGFQDSMWKELQNKITNYKNNISSILEIIEHSKKKTTEMSDIIEVEHEENPENDL